MSKFKAIRENLGMTQAALGKGLGLTQGAIHSYEKGSSVVSPRVAGKLIQLAALHGHRITFDDVYDAPPPPRKAKVRRAATSEAA